MEKQQNEKRSESMNRSMKTKNERKRAKPEG